MLRQLVFIDDSGDPGFKNSPSENFIMAAALFFDPKIATEVAEEMAKFKDRLGWQNNHEFKFRKTDKKTIKLLLETLSKFDFEIYAVYIDKRNYREVLPFLDREKVYNWAIRELLKTIPLDSAKIRIDGHVTRQYALKTAAYLRKEINTKKEQRILNIRFEDSKRVNLIQLADIIAGSINRSLQTDKTDSEDYIKIIRPKIVSLKQLKLR